MARSKVKGGGTKKVCLPAKKAASLSKKEKQKIIRAKESAGRSGKYKRSSKTNVKGARKKGATLNLILRELEVNINVMSKISGPCKTAAKRKFKVWPSAYASGWGVRFTKAENIEAAVNEDYEVWQRVALLLGWSEWSIQTPEQKEEAQTERKAKGQTKRKKTYKEKRSRKQKQLIELGF